jgi:hypothetical protein
VRLQDSLADTIAVSSARSRVAVSSQTMIPELTVKCLKCGAVVADATECPACGVIFAKLHDSASHRARTETVGDGARTGTVPSVRSPSPTTSASRIGMGTTVAACLAIVFIELCLTMPAHDLTRVLLWGEIPVFPLIVFLVLRSTRQIANRNHRSFARAVMFALFVPVPLPVTADYSFSSLFRYFPFSLFPAPAWFGVPLSLKTGWLSVFVFDSVIAVVAVGGLFLAILTLSFVLAGAREESRSAISANSHQ